MLAVATSSKQPEMITKDLVVRHLSAVTHLAPYEQDLVRSIGVRRRESSAGMQLARADEGRLRCSLILTGWAGRLRVLRDGRRQILTILLPGELVGGWRDPRPLEASLAMALTPVVTTDITPLYEAIERDPGRCQGLIRGLSILNRLEEANLLEQVVRLGQQTAYQRVGHWLLEMHERLCSAGAAKGDSFPMPLTQELIGDLLGLSIVHVNRILQQLRKEGLLSLTRGYATLHDLDRLRSITDYVTPDTSWIAKLDERRPPAHDFANGHSNRGRTFEICVP